MKVTNLFTLIVLSFFIGTAGCERNAKDLVNQKKGGDELTIEKAPVPAGPCNSNAYTITLESKTSAGNNWTWIWSVKNPNPGNGTNGTSQDMSHWGMQFGDCFNWNDVVSAAYSLNGTTWTSFTPVYKVDPSQNCVTTPVLKYGVGTSGTSKSYYKLVLSKNYATGTSQGYYKSGARMPCCTFTFMGVGCPETTSLCSYSQGYWFSKPQVVWCQNVQFGANAYTQLQGKTIWTDAPANSVAKHAFTQASALQLSMACTHNGAAIPAGISSAYNVVVNFLAGLSYNDILTGSYPSNQYGAVSAAAGMIGDWIQGNHCGEVIISE